MWCLLVTQIASENFCQAELAHGFERWKFESKPRVQYQEVTSCCKVKPQSSSQLLHRPRFLTLVSTCISEVARNVIFLPHSPSQPGEDVSPLFFVGFSSVFCQVSPTIYQNPFVPLVERGTVTVVSSPRTHHNCPGQGWNPGLSILSPVHLNQKAIIISLCTVVCISYYPDVMSMWATPWWHEGRAMLEYSPVAS